jgi:hypothetical protein
MGGEVLAEEEEGSEVPSDSLSWDSADAREAAVRDGFLGWLQDYIKNDLFQKFLDNVMPIFAPVFAIVSKFFQKIKKMAGQEDDEVGAEDLAEELMDAADPGVANWAQLGQSTNAMGGPIPGGGGGGGAGGMPPGVAEMAASAVSRRA